MKSCLKEKEKKYVDVIEFYAYADGISILDLVEAGVLISIKEDDKEIIIPKKYVKQIEFCCDADWNENMIHKARMKEMVEQLKKDMDNTIQRLYEEAKKVEITKQGTYLDTIGFIRYYKKRLVEVFGSDEKEAKE